MRKKLVDNRVNNFESHSSKIFAAHFPAFTTSFHPILFYRSSESHAFRTPNLPY